MLTVPLLVLGSFHGLTNGRVGFSLEFFFLEVGGAGTFLRVFFETLALVLVLEFIIYVGIRGYQVVLMCQN